MSAPRPYDAQRVANSPTDLMRSYRMSGATAALAWTVGLTLDQADRIAKAKESHIDLLWPECSGYVPEATAARKRKRKRIPDCPDHHVVALVVDGGFTHSEAAAVLGLTSVAVDRVMARRS